jgi:flagellar biosynthesis component FlhA
MNQVLQKLKPQYKQSQQQLKSLENTTSSEQILRECTKSLREFEQRLQTLEATLKNELGTYEHEGPFSMLLMMPTLRPLLPQLKERFILTHHLTSTPG